MSPAWEARSFRMANVPRGHHIVPAFYLARFTEGRKDTDRLFVVERSSKKTRFGKPKTEARRRDFYQVNAEADPFIVEKELGKIEGRVAAALRDLEETGAMTQEIHTLIVNFVALQAVRVPPLREQQRAFMEDVTRLLISTYADSPEAFEKSKEQLVADGYDIEDLTHEDLKHFADNPGVYTLEVDRTALVMSALETGKALVPILAGRPWCLYEAKNGLAFITSDNPVAMSANGPPPPGWTPAFGREDTAVTFPLSSRFAYVSCPTEAADYTAPERRRVALMNTLTAENSERFLYAQSEDFVWLNSDGQLRKGVTEEHIFCA